MHITLVDLEREFWQSIVDHDTHRAQILICEPALIVNAYGATKFDRAGYREMAEHGTKVVNSFDIHDMNVVFPNDTTAILSSGGAMASCLRAKAAEICSPVPQPGDVSTPCAAY